MMESGLTEEEAISKTGSPEQIAIEILENTPAESFRKKDVPGICLITVSMIMIAFSIYAVVHSHRMVNAAISIIGGADGPTSIFIAGRVGSNTVLLVVTGIVVLVTIVYFLIKKENKLTGHFYSMPGGLCYYLL